MAALRLIRVLDVLHEYACALEPARALPSRPLRPLASRTVEKSRASQVNFLTAGGVPCILLVMCALRGDNRDSDRRGSPSSNFCSPGASTMRVGR